jgi:RND family efflux transporter MFP subunit
MRATSSPSPSSQWRRGILGVATFLLAATLIPAAAPAQDGGGAPVQVEEATPREIVNVVRLSGSVVAPRTSRVSTALGGLVETVGVELGQRVERGATLVALDDELARHELDSARAALAEARADLDDAERRLRVAERLGERDNIPQTELDSRRAAVDRARATVQRRRAEAAAAQARLDRHTVEAPFAGAVTERAAEPGEWVSPGTALVELTATDRLYVDLKVPQRYFAEMTGEVPVYLSFDALPGRTVDGLIAARVPVSDSAARTFTLRVEPQADAPLPLTPGMSARAEIELATGETGVAVPRGAVMRYPDGRTTVWIAAQDGERTVARERQVELGRSFDGLVHVETGLEPGQRVVVRGNETLRPGQPVRIKGQGS